MRSGLQPVAISCNNNSYHERIAPPVDARARPQNASAASHVLRKPISMQDYEFPTIGVLGSSHRHTSGGIMHKDEEPARQSVAE
jgi:hypothetical protein